jgi:hypothetical protein
LRDSITSGQTDAYEMVTKWEILHMDVREVFANRESLLGKSIVVKGYLVDMQPVAYLVADQTASDIGRAILLAKDKESSKDDFWGLEIDSISPVRSALGSLTRPWPLINNRIAIVSATGILSQAEDAQFLFQLSHISCITAESPEFGYIGYYMPVIDYEKIGFSELPAIAVRDLLDNKDTYIGQEVRVAGCLTESVHNGQLNCYLADTETLPENPFTLMFPDFEPDPAYHKVLQDYSTKLRYAEEHSLLIKYTGILGGIIAEPAPGPYKEDVQIVGKVAKSSKAPFPVELVEVRTVAIIERSSASDIQVWDLSKFSSATKRL